MLGLRVKTSSANKKTCNGRKMHLEKTNKKKRKMWWRADGQNSQKYF